MELTIFERLIMLNVLPATGDILTIRTIRELRGKLEFTDMEHKALQFRRVYKCSECDETIEVLATEVSVPKCENCDKQMASTAGVQWLKDAEQVKDIEISDTGKTILKSTFIQLSDEKLLTEQHLSLYDKFVGV